MARAMAWLGRQPGGHDTSTLSRQEIARLVNAAASLLRVQCLPRSLVLWHNLREHGTSVQIRLGVSKLADGGLSAHAWVEVDGLALIDDTEKLGRYTVLPSVAIARNLGLSQRD